eukprot:GILK01004817.1.p1 GENE.GILK01004817.1~~GILK01004817.1.p1  ORF type:complete len:328 (+),score=51.38 GILK01004817.1:56-1039(+)
MEVLSSEQVLERLHRRAQRQKLLGYAMYSSIVGGIFHDPALMLVPIDDHMVHRGHAVFDTATVKKGKVYQLDQHLDRFVVSATHARIPLLYDKAQMKSIILQTIVAGGRRDGLMVKYWLSVGGGGFSIVPEGTSAFYVVVFDYPSRGGNIAGIQEHTVSVPLKTPFLARIKTVNYLMNALTAMESREKGGVYGVQVDPEGYVAEGSTCNVAFVDEDGILRTPPFDAILAGITVKRILFLAQSLVERGVLRNIVVEPVKAVEGKQAAEMLILGGAFISPVISWDGIQIGNGRPGPVFAALHQLLEEDQISGEGQIDALPDSQSIGTST